MAAEMPSCGMGKRDIGQTNRNQQDLGLKDGIDCILGRADRKQQYAHHDRKRQAKGSGGDQDAGEHLLRDGGPEPPPEGQPTPPPTEEPPTEEQLPAESEEQ